MPTALLIIDIQNDYFPGGKAALVGSTEASLKARELLEHFRNRGWPVFHVQHMSTRPGATFFLPDTPGARIHDNVAPRADEPVLTKHSPNAFRDTDLQARLRASGVDEIVTAGMMTHMCVDSSVRAGFDLGFRMRLAQDACATRALSFAGQEIAAGDVHAAYLAGLNGMFAKVQPTRAILADLFSAPGQTA
jgi:nicotinamidase-related amidase